MSKFIVELQEGVYLADWEGDPGRTLKMDSAKHFKKKTTAKKALEEVRTYRPFINADIIEID